jgi:hypothetical protein
MYITPQQSLDKRRLRFFTHTRTEETQPGWEIDAEEEKRGMEHSRARHGHGDPYNVLGVAADASGQDIVRAYHRAAHRAHPDAQPADPQAVTRFQALTDAYDLLSDAGRRAAYDRAHPAAGQQSQPPRPGSPGAGPRPPGPPCLLPHHQPIWTGPVYVRPPGGPATPQDRHSPPGAARDDPAIILGVHRGQAWSRLW